MFRSYIERHQGGLSVAALTLLLIWMQGPDWHTGPNEDRKLRIYNTRIAASPLVRNSAEFSGQCVYCAVLSGRVHQSREREYKSGELTQLCLEGSLNRGHPPLSLHYCITLPLHCIYLTLLYYPSIVALYHFIPLEFYHCTNAVG